MTDGAELVQRNLASALVAHFPGEAAAIIESAPVDETVALLQSAGETRAVEVIRQLAPETAAQALARLPAEPASQVLAALDPNRAAALLRRLDPEQYEQLLSALSQSDAGELRALMSYPPDTAGAMMDPRVAAFRPGQSVHEVLPRLRSLRRKRVQDLYLVDEEGRLAGSVALHDVVQAEREELLGSLVSGPSPAVQATDSRETVVAELEARRVLSLPVVDFEGRLLGVLRPGELLAAAQQEATAGLLTMVGAGEDERALSPPLFAVRKRLPWLEINLLTAFLAAAVVGLFESTIAQYTALAVLLPVVAGQSGNSGAQALAVTMRGLALREIRVRHWLRVSAKELLVGAVNGVAVALTTAAGVFVWSGSTGLTLVIGISMVLSMVAAALAGAVIPMILTSLRQDPAQSSSIILTTVTDVVGFFSFLGIATLLASTL